MGAWASQYLQNISNLRFRPGRTGTGPLRDALPGRTAWQAGSCAQRDPRARAGLPGRQTVRPAATMQGSLPRAEEHRHAADACGSAAKPPLACAGARFPFARTRDLLAWLNESISIGQMIVTLCWGAKRQTGAGLAKLPQAARSGLLALATLSLGGSGVWAQETPSERSAPDETSDAATAESHGPVRIGGETAPQPCVQVDVGGYRAGHLDCASQRLEAAARIAQAQARSAIETPVIDATSPDVQTGVANQAATRLRMGNALGNSVHPQRPNRPAPMPRGGFRP